MMLVRLRALNRFSVAHHRARLCIPLTSAVPSLCRFREYPATPVFTRDSGRSRFIQPGPNSESVCFESITVVKALHLPINSARGEAPLSASVSLGTNATPQISPNTS